MDTGSPKRPTVASPGFPKEPMGNLGFAAVEQQFYKQTAYGIAVQASQVQPLNLAPLRRREVLTLNRERLAAEGPGPKSMESVIQLEHQHLQQVAVVEGAHKNQLAAEAEARRLSLDVNWHNYQDNRRREEERARHRAEEARSSREISSWDGHKDIPTKERGIEST